MKLEGNEVLLGATGLIKNLPTWVREAAGNKSPVMGVSKEHTKVPLRERDGFKTWPFREHKASLVEDHLK